MGVRPNTPPPTPPCRLRYQTAFIIQHPPHHTHTHIHPSSTLESIDKQHKQQRGDKQGDITKPSQQQDFGSRTIFQFNIPKQRGVNAAPQKKKKRKNLVQGVFDLYIKKGNSVLSFVLENFYLTWISTFPSAKLRFSSGRKTPPICGVYAARVCSCVFLYVCVCACWSQTKQGCWNAAGTADFCWLADSAVPVPSPDGGND